MYYGVLRTDLVTGLFGVHRCFRSPLQPRAVVLYVEMTAKDSYFPSQRTAGLYCILINRRGCTLFGPVSSVRCGHCIAILDEQIASSVGNVRA